MYLTCEPAVTSRIEVDCLRPVRIGTRLEVEVEVEARDQQGIDVAGELRDADGRPLARCRTRMAFVNPDHFVRNGEPAGARSV